MRELTRIEAEQTAGGAGPVVVFLVAAGASIATAYVHEKVGGLEGIKKGIKRLVDNVKNQAGDSD